MKLVIFSTDTKHHRYFINKIAKKFDICSIVYERKKITKDYITGPFFENEEDKFEDKFFDEVSYEIDDKKMIEVHSVNNKALSKYLQHLKPDLGISFGTGLIKPYIFDIPEWGTINIHRGCIDSYRGLDSDLWALYNKDFDKIDVTIHYIDEELDTGDVLLQKNLSLEKINHIYSMRYYTTVMATEMVIEILNRFSFEDKKIDGKPQVNFGDYFSAMGIEKKQKALENFINYKKGIL